MMADLFDRLFPDPEAQVVYWIITLAGRHSISISCLPIDETALDY
jgi:hypothetical protein